MGTGWLTWTCLLLAAGAPAGADDIVHMNQRGFQIPIRIEPQRQAEVRELLLYLSKDQGRTWGIYARATPSQRGFDFHAVQDGLLCFSIAVIDQKGHQDPPDIYHAPIGQKIQIDTVKPIVRILSADRSGDEVVVSWDIQEERPEWTSLRLEYRAGDTPASQWTPLGVEPGERGNKRFRPGTPGDITVRLSMRDLAGNEGVTEKVVLGGRVDKSLQVASAVTTPGGSMPPPPAPVTGGPDSTAIPHSETAMPLAHSSNVVSPRTGSLPGPAESSPMPTRGALPALQIVNKRQVKLGFNVSKFGPSGLGSVDVYLTMDEGATWEKSTADPHVYLPVSPEVKGPAPVHGTVTVSLPKDAVTYGFYLVVKSRAGLGKPPPRPGDPPHVRMEVDTTLPMAELYVPQPAPGKADSLILTWKAEDRNLAANPVSLEWSANASGPWTFIGDTQLPNSGKYTWTVPPSTPPQVYLKLTVRDTANNVAVAQTDKPVLIDLSQPETADVQVEPER